MTGWTTRETSEKCGLSQHTLRWYERIGLLNRVARTADGRRRYSDAERRLGVARSVRGQE